MRIASSPFLSLKKTNSPCECQNLCSDDDNCRFWNWNRGAATSEYKTCFLSKISEAAKLEHGVSIISGHVAGGKRITLRKMKEMRNVIGSGDRSIHASKHVGKDAHLFILREGVYTCDVNSPDESCWDNNYMMSIIRPDYTLTCETHRGGCVIDGENLRSIAFITGNQGSGLEMISITITNGDGHSNRSRGVLTIDGATTTFTNCRFINNYSTAGIKGAAIWLRNSCSISINYCEFSGNSVSGLAGVVHAERAATGSWTFNGCPTNDNANVTSIILAI